MYVSLYFYSRDKYCKGVAMNTKQLSLDELLELIELENLPTAQEEKNDMYYAYLRTKLDTIVAYQASTNSIVTVTAAAE